MKNLILITFLLIFFGANAQTTKPIDGFLGIKFGSSVAEVTEALKAKGGILDEPNTDTSTLAFTNISLANRQSTILFVYFVNGQVFQAEFVFKPELDTKSIEYYNKLISDINEVYEAGTSVKNFKQPYTDGDGYEITAIKSGNANYQTTWTNNNNLVWLRLEPNKNSNILVRLTYRDGNLIKIFRDRQKEKNKSEF